MHCFWKNLHSWSRRSWQIFKSVCRLISHWVGYPCLNSHTISHFTGNFFVSQNIHRFMNKPTRGCACEANQKEENHWLWSHYCLSAGKEYWYSSAHFSCWVIIHLQLIFSEVFFRSTIFSIFSDVIAVSIFVAIFGSSWRFSIKLQCHNNYSDEDLIMPTIWWSRPVPIGTA